MSQERLFHDEEQIQAVHGNIYPEDIRNPAFSHGVIRFGKFDEDVKILRFSPLGCEFRVGDCTAYKEVQHLEITMSGHSNMVSLEAYIVYISEELNVVGVRWSTKKTKPKDEQSERKKRFDTNDRFLPTAVFTNPLKFDEMILCRIVNVSESGAMIETSIRNKFLATGMSNINVRLVFPIVGEIETKMTIAWVKVVENEGDAVLVFGAEFKVNRAFKSVVGEYVMQFCGDSTLNEIRQAGLIVANSKNTLFRYVLTRNDYDEVIKLRAHAYDRYKEDIDISELSDVYDSRSRILMANMQNKLAGTLRITFHESIEELEQAQYTKISKGFVPEVHDLVEMTRLAIGRDFTGTDLMLQMLREVMKVMIGLNRTYLIGSAPESLLRIYKKVGAEASEFTYSPASCPSLKLYVIKINMKDVLLGKIGNNKIWKKYCADLIPYAVDQGYITIDTQDKVVINIKKAIGAISGF